ncbi:leucyl aminopeptidase [Buchananella hordeovulneris]|uniref:Probable cytosol aminopeptidase n=1 Tax=Buchananella hordeovulneris TaxID=52770 RepID=A0A1Q5PXF9_9ACTO|nr:leucyl aminopeptidase [Buchananella hordeovulneris]OKL52294.1 leucyl aminopeptidase [Buchananella hordeovulneris]RRD45515.1 leucyl aminopeptidase [Buchananella hordeovulneris]RRD52356.1 leucyl aminopeptidase [Buchananella hordeovulneris]
MTAISLSSKDVAKFSADVVVFAVSGAQVQGVANKKLAKELERLAALLQVRGKDGEFVQCPAPAGVGAPVVAFVGLDAERYSATEARRRAAGSAVRALAETAHVALALPADTEDQLQAIVEGALLGAHSPGLYKSDADAVAAQVTVLAAGPRGTDFAAACKRGQILATHVLGARDLVNSSPNHLYPEAFAKHAAGLAKGKVKAKVYDAAELAKMGCGGLVGVGQGSHRPPHLVKLTYTPAKAGRHVALVGKGITFDSGGLSLKPAKGMEEMKSDMAGAAAVLHTVLAAAELGLPVKVTAWLALAENMPGGGAQRPSDVITMRNGKTVEVLNTDAEGRLVMADALALAAEEKPDLLLDMATLTGAQVIALGTEIAAVMGCESVREAVVAAGAASDEQVWPMPLPQALREGLQSPVADLANIGGREGGMLSAGLFLREFTDSLSWAHIDIAGPSFRAGKPANYVSTGGTGYGVRLLTALLAQ